MQVDNKKARNKFIMRFLAVGILVYPALMLVVVGLNSLLNALGQMPDSFSWIHSLYGVVCWVLSPGTILMMDAEHTRDVLWALPFVTIANALWYVLIGSIVWYVVKWRG
jgi:hypothetical protein